MIDISKVCLFLSCPLQCHQYEWRTLFTWTNIIIISKVLNFRSFGKSWNITFHLNGQAVIVCERFFFSRFLKKMPRTFFNQSLMDRQTEMIEKMEFLCRRWIKGRWNAWLREKSKVGSVMWRQLPLKTPTRKKTTRQLGPWQSYQQEPDLKYFLFEYKSVQWHHVGLPSSPGKFTVTSWFSQCLLLTDQSDQWLQPKKTKSALLLNTLCFFMFLQISEEVNRNIILAHCETFPTKHYGEVPIAQRLFWRRFWIIFALAFTVNMTVNRHLDKTNICQPSCL